ncbi:transcription termination/antitermination protein NusA [Candidatus Falkowbacteria bacterium]|nr:transcription termination/antitermination protein NusA [Candidatus Falkowbacteria bacterium]
MDLDLKAMQQAIKQIAAEKGLSEKSITETLNYALAAAYRKDFGQKNQNIIFEFDPDSGEAKVYDKKVVVDFPPDIIAEIDVNGRDKKFVKSAKGEIITEGEEGKEGKEGEEGKMRERKMEIEEEKEGEIEEGAIKFNPKTEILLDDAKKLKKKAKVGDEIIMPLEIPDNFGRMAAQTAKQVIIQKIREAERESLFGEFKDKERHLINGIIQRREMRGVLVDLGKITALMPFEEQSRNERYNPGERMKFYIVSVDMSVRGPEVIVSRATPEMLRELFIAEIPEVANNSVEIMAISREAGSRAKVAVKSNQENIDPIGSCVGQRGARIQTIINELGGEKVDIILWDEDSSKFISNSLSPAKIITIDLDEKNKVATVSVKEDQLSLAIGKEGQNVRLAAKLTGWKINIMKETASGEKEEVKIEGKEEEKEKKEGKEIGAELKEKEKEEKPKKEKKEKKEKKTKKTKKEKETKE